MPNQIPPPQDAPVVDTGGRFSPIWYRWFYSLFVQLGPLPPGPLGTAATKNATDNALADVASVQQPITATHVAVFTDNEGTIGDGGVLGTAARKAASNPGVADLASVVGPIAAGHLAVFADTAGSVEDGGPAGGAGGKTPTNPAQPYLSSPVGAFTTNHFAVAADALGSIKDGGVQGTISAQNANAVAITGGAVAVPALTASADNGMAFTSQTSDTGGSTATLTNSPAAGNPTFWLRIQINGANFSVPAWPA